MMQMDQERRDKIDEIFQAALELAPGERKAFVERACAGDEGLRAAASVLVDAHEHAEAEGFIQGLTFCRPGPVVGNREGLSAEQSVGPYKIVRKLGSGGMGEVYLAHDSRLDRLVALKILSGQLTTDGERVRRFRREALAASSLNHPNIITVYEIGGHEGRDFIATEYVEGVTLRTRMRGKRLSLVDALDIVIQLAGALGVAHAAGIVHRDLKPENIMVRPDGLIKVLDFGIAKYTPGTRASDSKHWVKTATGVVMGTTAYMSPEQARGKEVDARADIWSIGVIFYEMVARQLPFRGQTPPDRIAAILERDPEPLSKRRSDVPPELERIVRRALAKNKEERYQLSADLAEDLRKLRATVDEGRGPRFSLPAPVRSFSAFSRTRALVAVVSLLILIAAVVTGLNYFRSGRGEAIDSLAVLPFINASGSADLEYLSDGISESLINSLSQLPQLKVTARSSSFRYKGRETDVEELAKALGVRALVSGRVVQRGDTLQVSVELVDAQDKRQLWGEQYNRKFSDTQAVQEEIARAIAEKLRLVLSGAQGQLAGKRHTESDDAYQSYLKGRFHWNKRTSDGIKKAIGHFNQAIEKDPGFALAYAGLADCYVVVANPVPPREKLPKARAAAKRALELDETLAEAHTTLARVLTIYDWDWAGAEKEFKRAIELNPRYSVAHEWYGGYFAALGRHDESIAERKQALELDPLSVIINFELAQAFYHARDFDRAIEQGQKTLELDPNFPPPNTYLSAAYEQKGMYQEAAEGFQKGQTLRGGTDWSLALAGLGHLYARLGRKDEARAILDELQRLSRQEYVPADSMALVYAGLGEKDQAFAWLDKAYEERSFRLLHIKVEPMWDSLRSDPRFAQLLRRMGLTP